MKLTAWILGAAVCTLLAPVPALADVAAYWRHEEGPAGGLIPAGDDTVFDSSGNGQHMRTFDPTFTSATYTSTVSPLALRSGLPNTLALDFGPGGDDAGLNDDNYTSNKPIATNLYTAMTFELAFRMDAIGGYQAVFGKDGKPLGDAPGEPDSPVPPFKVLIRGDSFPDDVPNQLFVEWIDGDGDIHFLATRETVTVGAWNHVAFTLTGSAAELWVAGDSGPYTLKDSVSGADFAGPSGEVLIFEPLGYSVGRGMFNNGVTDWADAIIDEVRISDTALTPDQFLFLTSTATTTADFDDDGDVDGADFLTWQRNVGATGTGTRLTGDANNDTNVNAADLAVWKSQFGPSAPGAVPEPSTAALAAAIGVAAAIVRWRRPRHRVR